MEKYNLTDLSFQLDPHPVLCQMRKEDPVYWCEELGHWFITRYDDVVTAFRDGERFSADRKAIAEDNIEAQLPGEQPPEAIRDFLRILSKMTFVKDGSEHRQLRAPMTQAFKNRFSNFPPGSVEETAKRILVPLKSRESFDVIRDFAVPFFMLSLVRFLGTPTEDWGTLHKWSMEYTAFLGGSQEKAAIEELGIPANKAILGFEQYFYKYVKSRNGSVPDGFVKEFIDLARADGLTDEDIIAQIIMMVPAANMPSTDQFGNTVELILSRPAVYHELRGNPRLVESAVQEGMRCDPAAAMAHRITTEDIDMRGQKIRKGSSVFLSMAAANRDPEVFEVPGVFDIHREETKKHITFGSGAHTCPGAKLASLEMEIGLRVLLCEMPVLEFAGTPKKRFGSMAFKGYENVPVRWKS